MVQDPVHGVVPPTVRVDRFPRAGIPLWVHESILTGCAALPVPWASVEKGGRLPFEAP